MKNLVTFLLLLLFTPLTFAQIDINSIQNNIKKQHVHWIAKNTWISKFSNKEIQHLLGLRKLPEGQLDFKPFHILSPTSLDWRNVNGINWLGSIMNQGNCGSCVAFAVIATLEAQTSISQGIPWMSPTFSPQMLFDCGGGGCDFGWLPDEAVSFLASTGVPDEACMPYTSGSTGKDVACSQKCSDSSNRITTILNSNTPTSYGGDIESVKAALKKGPLITTLTVYEDFLTYNSGIYKHVSGNAAGGHAVSLIGFDDNKQAWLIRNSWGSEWGEKGFAWISWDDVSGVGANTWQLNMPDSDVLSVISPSNREIISGKYTIILKQKTTQKGNVMIHISNGKIIKEFACSITDCQFDTSTLPEGRYEIYAVNIGIKSQVREFFILNSVPKLNISFIPVEGLDLSKPLTGRPEFYVTANFGAVPIQHLEFRVLDKDGQIATIKSNDYVLPQMKMGWRTITVPNGNYKILFHGETTYLGKIYTVESNSYSITVAN